MKRKRTGMKIHIDKMLLIMCFVLSSLFGMISVPVYAEAESSISIDGYYDDWEGKPITLLTWNSNNGEANHDVSMVKDEDYIYIYVGMHPKYHSAIPIDAIYLSVNGQECQLFLRYANDNNGTDWGHEVNLKKTGTYLGLHPFTYYPNYSLGDAAVTIFQGNPNDKLEMRINIKSLENVMGIKEGTINSGSKISLRMPNVGRETVELVGTSTGAVIGLLLCAGGVIAVKWRRNRKMRLAQ